jgi:dihydroxyacetone kinase
VVRAACEQLKTRGVNVTRIVTGSLMTSLSMAGFTLTLLLPVGADDLVLLDAPCEASAWPGCANPAEQQRLREEAEMESQLPCIALPEAASKKGASPTAYPAASGTPLLLSAPAAASVKAAVIAAAKALIDAAGELNDLDSKVGDGDCGLAFKRGANALLADCDSYDFSSPVNTLRAMADSVRRSMGGSSGGFYDLALRAASNSLASSALPPGSTTTSQLVASLDAGVAAIRQYGNAQVGDRTMLDALIPAIEAMRGAASVQEAIKAGAAAATSGAQATSSMVALAGRSSYLSASQVSGVADPGATAASVWFNAIATSIAE